VQLGKLEILAPAKNREIGIAAINCGADSLYIAGPGFGARESAGNPVGEIEKLAAHARRYGVKVYVVINTILYDTETEAALSVAKQVYEAGCDALIVQDLGLLKAGLPPLPVFASTQTNIRSLDQARFLESLGFSRLILARELSLDQIREIRENTSVELESFVHGALCVSYSGQCYISSHITGRSGNRGECAQICRNNFNMVNDKGEVLVRNKPLLSLKDLNLAEYIPALAHAGVTSFKIEGRLKDASYVKNIVRYYRKVTDAFMESDKRFVQASLGRLHGGFTPRPGNTFNRGYTTLFADGTRGSWNSGVAAKGLGEFVGRAGSVSADGSGNLLFSHDSNMRLANGDGLCIVTQSGEVKGLRVSVSVGDSITANLKMSVPKGSLIYRNFDKEFERELEANMPERIIDAFLSFESDGGTTTLVAITPDGRRAKVVAVGGFEPAKEPAKAKETVYTQLQKRAGLYNFIISHYMADNQLFYPMSQLNGWRRQLALELEQQPVNKASLPAFTGVPKGTLDSRPLDGKVVDYRANISNELSRELYTALGAKVKGVAFELDAPETAELMRCKYCIKYELGICPHHKNPKQKGVVAEHTGTLFLENNGRKFRLGFDCKNCEMIIFG
jgi:putative protease